MNAGQLEFIKKISSISVNLSARQSKSPFITLMKKGQAGEKGVPGQTRVFAYPRLLIVTPALNQLRVPLIQGRKDDF